MTHTISDRIGIQIQFQKKKKQIQFQLTIHLMFNLSL